MMMPSARSICTISRNPDQLEFLGTLPTPEEIAQHWRDKAIEKYREVEKYLQHDKKTGLFVSTLDCVEVELGNWRGYNRYYINSGNAYERLDIDAKELLKLFYGEDMALDVHHKNGIRSDDRKENIKFLPREEHMRLHKLKERRRMQEMGCTPRKGFFNKTEMEIAERKHLYRQIVKSVEERN